MQVTIAAAGTKTGKATIHSLLFHSPESEPLHVCGVYRHLDKVPAAFSSHPHFSAVKGDVSVEASLDFTGSDAIVAIVPPVPADSDHDLIEHATIASNNIKVAIEKSGTIRTLVLLSSGGAEFDKDVGEIKANHKAESILCTTKAESIIFVRCAYFMENWAIGMDSLRLSEPFFYSTITPLDYKIPMVAISDVGSTLAMAITKKRFILQKPYIFELHGPQEYSPLDVQTIFAKLLGQDVEIRPVEKKDLRQFYEKIFSAKNLDNWVQMATSILPDGVLGKEYLANAVNRDVVYGDTDLGQAFMNFFSVPGM